MSVDASHERPAGLRLRASRPSRVIGWALTVFGVLFGLSGLAVPGDVGALVTMLAGGAVSAAIGLSMATARVTAGQSGLQYRFGPIRRSWHRDDISEVAVGEGSGMGYPRVAMQVVLRTGERRILTALQCQDIKRGRRHVEQ